MLKTTNFKNERTIIMKKFKKIIAMGCAAVMAVSAMSMSAFAASDEIYALSEEETRARGFVIINEDIYDLNGNLIIDMENGFTPDGSTLDENFKVTYASNTTMSVRTISNFDNFTSPLSFNDPIFSGTADVNMNVDGNQGDQYGPDFKMTAAEPYVHLAYYSGNVSGLNIAVHNKTRNTLVDWVSNVLPGYISAGIYVYNAARPNDYYKAVVSGQGSSGNATFKIFASN